MDWALLLVLLICPLMMLFMHGGHKGHKHGGRKKGSHSHHGHGEQSHKLNEHVGSSSGVERLDSYKVKQLEGEIEFLKEQNELLQKKVEDLSHDVTHKSKI
ncbi:DUF2933 domain-containing protein [Aquibacillus sediminis]|uniref:DUF2933 domain-containing protein n=1 Tax=Aquibacillus sediminis TaxID=2574734 RepID=UPI001109B7B2|nr:bZIP transcription factor [Aquibacillus sediminis]